MVSLLAVSTETVPGYPRESLPDRPRASEIPRDRLFHRLQQAITRRLVLVTAGPGFGKSALLADFCRRAPHPTAVLKLDPVHRDPLAFARSIVEAVVGADATTPWVVSGCADPGLPGSDAILRALGSAVTRPRYLVLDDFHLVDDVPEIRAMVHEIISGAPDGLGLIIGSRRRPSLPLARFRARGELVEIGPEHLPFDAQEAAHILGDLELGVAPDVVDAIRTHTGGWPAALRLVEAAIRDRHPVDDSLRRCPIRLLAAARPDIDAYLAEEVIASLPQQLLWFLLRTSVLDDVHADLAALAAGVTTEEAGAAIDAAWVSGLVWSPEGATSGYRYRPVVREYLEAQLRSSIGDPGVAAIHRTIAVSAKEADWRTAAKHAARAGDELLVGEVIARNLDAIVDRGEAADAIALLDGTGAALPPGALELLESRSQFAAGRLDRALAFARTALESAATVGVTEGAPDIGARALSNLRAIERVVTCRDATGSVTEERDLREEAERFELALRLAPASPSYRRGHILLGLALVSFARALLRPAVVHAEAAVAELGRTGSPREVGLALALASWATAHDGRWHEARERLRAAVAAASGDRTVLEIALAVSRAYGDPEDETRIEADLSALDPDDGLDADLPPSLASAIAGIVGAPAIAAATRNSEFALSASVGEAGRGLEAAERALAHAVRAGARVWADIDRLLVGLARGGRVLSDGVAAAATGDGAPLVVLAPLLARRLDDLDPSAAEALAIHIAARPERWRHALRDAIRDGTNASRLAAGRALALVGTPDDITPLHLLSRSARARGSDATLARQLARRLAPPVFFDDLGRVAFSVGPVLHPGTTMRRKVLALVCFLLTRPDLSATKDQVLDALWPDLEPDVAANSLNQTIYFLRRILDPSYIDERSADYLHHDSDVVWLDPDLVASRSRRCRELIRRCRPVAAPADVDALSEAYTERFALDFAYESWAEPYRESLHAAYLEVVERAVDEAAANGDLDRGIALARRVLEIDPVAEQMELTLLRLYRRTGARAAAAEQYAHYASVLREELGVEPPPLDAI